ncbi:sugar kinase, partial [Cereibacter changlensis]
MTQRFVALGEAMVEMAPTGEPGTFAMGFAGDTLNTAWYLRRALPGWSVDYATCIGTDAVSDRMLGFLEDAGIGVGHVARLAERTVGLYLIELRDGERSFSYWRGQSAARLLARDPAR